MVSSASLASTAEATKVGAVAKRHVPVGATGVPADMVK